MSGGLSLSRSSSSSKSVTSEKKAAGGAGSRSSSLSKKSREGSRSRSRSPRSRSPLEHEYRLHIADIAEGVKNSELKDYFAQFGELKELWTANCPPCFGFAVFKKKENALSALKAADGKSFGGLRIRVTHARPRTRGFGRNIYNANMRCYQCGHQGHFYRDCPEVTGEELDDSYYSRDDGGGGGRRGYSSRKSSRYDDRDYHRSERDYHRGNRDYNRHRTSSRRHRDDRDYDRDRHRRRHRY